MRRFPSGALAEGDDGCSRFTDRVLESCARIRLEDRPAWVLTEPVGTTIVWEEGSFRYELFYRDEVKPVVARAMAVGMAPINRAVSDRARPRPAAAARPPDPEQADRTGLALGSGRRVYNLAGLPPEGSSSTTAGGSPTCKRDEDAEPPKLDRALLRRVFEYGRPYRLLLVGVLATIFVISVLSVIPPVLSRQLVDVAIPQGDIAASHPARGRHDRRPLRQRPDRRDPAMAVGPCRGRDHLRPEATALRPPPGHVAAVLHQHQDRGADLAAQQRRGWRPAGGHRNLRLDRVQHRPGGRSSWW